MRAARAAGGTVAFLVVAPGVVAGLVPWLLTGWELEAPLSGWLPVRVLGVALIVAGGVVLLDAFARFVREGLGTPAPVAPTAHLVVGGLYRYVRNPMYLAVGSIIVGEALLLGQLILLPYAALFGLAVWAFVRWYEEPTLRQQFGAEYDEYERAVPGWWPRRSPWVSASARRPRRPASRR
jgi:protein-S-isoprenylcysteine O-methyltransferase Ste14